MNKEARIQKIKEIENWEHISTKKVKWKDDSVYMNVYKVPLEYLVYNKYNGRIKSRVKSLERFGKEIDISTDEGKKKIETLLWDSKPDRNKKTKQDIIDNGQLKVGIITRDGIVIDWNRRTMLLNQIEKYDYFEAVILPTTIEENKREIRKLETSYQMWEDKKLDYNPIEKYLTVKDSISEWDKIEEIAEWMWEKESKIKEWIDVMKTMDDYLDYLGYNWYYTQLDGREDAFITLTNWLGVFFENQEQKSVSGSLRAFDGYTMSDLDDLKTISYDYIRASYEGKSFRIIAKGNRENHFFWNKEIWQSFRDNHFKNIEPILDSEDEINFDSPDLWKTLKSRDNLYIEKALSLLTDNLKDHEQLIYNQKHKSEPDKLIKKSIDAVNAVKDNSDIKKQDVIEKVEELHQITSDILIKKSPVDALKHIYNLLLSIQVGKNNLDREEFLEYATNISKEAYKLQKEIKNIK